MAERSLPVDPVKARLLRLYDALLTRFGQQRWWPGDSAFEVAIGAILTQHTAWRNAERAIAALKAERLLNPARLRDLSPGRLAALIRPAGTFTVKARRLKAFMAFLWGRFRGRVELMAAAPLDEVRRDLLSVPGIGPETADAILLYAAGRPVFVADAYARRIMARHRLIPPRIGYEPLRSFFESHLPRDPALFDEYHALLVTAGKRHCRVKPCCGGCPLQFDLMGRRPKGAASR
jgi:endonuclease-3 related protein